MKMKKYSLRINLEKDYVERVFVEPTIDKAMARVRKTLQNIEENPFEYGKLKSMVFKGV